MSGKLFDTINNFVKKNVGTGDSLLKSGSTGMKSFPWQNRKDSFLPPVEIDGNNWNKLYPYLLKVVDISKNQVVGQPSALKKNQPILSSIKTSTGNINGVDYIVQLADAGSSWTYQFPITPQQLSVTDQFAINTYATNRGIVEEHNGVKFKMITMRGTTGIWNQKPSLGASIKSPSILGGLARNSLESLGNLNNRVKNLFSGESKSSESPNNLTETGYYKALQLQQFLENYAQYKKDPSNKNWRLVLDVPKENQAYIVTPIQFNLEKSAQKPNEYIWTIQLKAWKRYQPSNQKFLEKTSKILGDANKLQKFVNTVRETRRAISAASDLVKAVRSDVGGALETLRQTSLVVKDLSGLAFSAADLPKQLQKDIESSIKTSLANAKDPFQRPNTGNNSGLDKFSDPQAKLGAAVSLLKDEMKTLEGLDPAYATEGSLGTDLADAQALSPVSGLIESSESNFDTLDAVDINSLSLTPEQQAAIDDETALAQLTTVDDLRAYREDMLLLTTQLEAALGGADANYERIYNISNQKNNNTELTVENYELLTSMYNLLDVYDSLTATKVYDDNKQQSPLEFVGQLAEQDQVDFQLSTAKFLAPVPFGLTIEQISARYLGDPNRWIEIVTLNSLRSPYIDEDGYSYPLLSNATGRQFNVNDSQNLLYTGQKINLISNSIPMISRTIISLEKITENNTLVTVDGDNDLDIFTTLGNAKMIGYLAGTVNSQNQIFIPTDLPAQPDDRVELPPAFRNSELTKISKVDWLLTEDGDVAVNNQGEVRLANGLNNLVQALQIKVKTRKNSILQNPEFGVGLGYSMSVADIEAGVLFNELNQIILADERYSGIERLQVSINGGEVFVDMAVNIANGSGILPITFTV